MDPLRRADLAPPPRTLVEVFRATVEPAGDEPVVDAGMDMLSGCSRTSSRTSGSATR